MVCSIGTIDGGNPQNEIVGVLGNDHLYAEGDRHRALPQEVYRILQGRRD